MKAILFGCGEIFETTQGKDELLYGYDIVAVMSNRPGGKKYVNGHEYTVVGPDQLDSLDFEIILICTPTNYAEIRNQLLMLGVAADKIRSLKDEMVILKWTKRYNEENRPGLSEVIRSVRERGLGSFNGEFLKRYDHYPVDVNWDDEFMSFIMVNECICPHA